jgi:hypothetical protein
MPALPVHGQDAENLLRYESEEGAFMDARLGKQVDAARLANLRSALKILWLHYHEQEAIPFSIATPAAVLAYHWKDAADDVAQVWARSRHNGRNGGSRPVGL